jgi:hypothetical protein
MGVCCVLYAVSDSTITQVLADPPLVWRVIDPHDASAYVREIGVDGKRSWIARLFGATPVAPPERSLAFSEHELQVADLDKSWDGLSGCLRACRPDVPGFFEGSGKIGRVEVGYGPALYHRSDTMLRIAEAYLSVTEAELFQALRTADLSKRYLANVWKRGDHDSVSYLVENFAELRCFLQHTREHSLGAIVQYT